MSIVRGHQHSSSKNARPATAEGASALRRRIFLKKQRALFHRQVETEINSILGAELRTVKPRNVAKHRAKIAAYLAALRADANRVAFELGRVRFLVNRSPN